MASDTVLRTVTVEAPQERAFAVFTRMKDWWPLDSHHIGAADAVDAVIEPRAGGRWFEQAADGSTCDWGRVLAYEPPARLLLAWMLNADWQYDPDEAQASEIEVRFVAEGPTTTRVELAHRGFERAARGGEIREAVGGEGGWNGLLQAYAAAARA